MVEHLTTFDVERTVSRSPPPIPGGPASPAEAARACRMAGGALDVERRTVARKCACPTDVPAAHRQDVCPRCGGPVLNEIGRSGCARSGHAQEVETPMPDEPYTLAQDALDRAVLNEGARSVPAACPGCGDDLQGRMLLVRDQEDSGAFDSLVEDRGHGDGPAVIGACWTCDTQLLPDTVILRDRHRRCEDEIRELARVA